MLILTRNAGQKICIGEDTVVTVLCMSGGQVRIGVSAPKEVEVHREEVFNKIKSERIAACNSGLSA